MNMMWQEKEYYLTLNKINILRSGATNRSLNSLQSTKKSAVLSYLTVASNTAVNETIHAIY
jgi:hypothetical protein